MSAKRKPLSRPEQRGARGRSCAPLSFAFVMAGLLASVAWLSGCSPPNGPASSQVNARAADQLSIAGNACGPTALLNSFRFGSPACQQVAASIPGHTDREKLRHIIIKHGGTWSRHIPQRYRWSRRGINAADLTDIANELGASQSLPTVRLFIPHHYPRAETLLRKTHQQLANSLRRGFPPIVGLRRYDGTKLIDSHFVTILQVPDVLDKNAQHCEILYLDPVGGDKRRGVLRVMVQQGKMLLTADLPETPLGKNQASSRSYVKLDSLIALP